MLGLVTIGLTISSHAQIAKMEKLSEISVYATNYKYLQSTNTGEVAAVPVELLQSKVASYNVKESEVYKDDYDVYEVNFYIPDGTILAAYDKEGILLRTVERFKNMDLPTVVYESVRDRFPGWDISKDIYLVNYHQKTGATKKYKLKLENGDERLRVKLDENGIFL